VSIAAASNWYFLTTRVIPNIATSPQPPTIPQYQTPVALYQHVEYVKKTNKIKNSFHILF
jgi:hypothetical protein